MLCLLPKSNHLVSNYSYNPTYNIKYLNSVTCNILSFITVTLANWSNDIFLIYCEFHQWSIQ